MSDEQDYIDLVRSITGAAGCPLWTEIRTLKGTQAPHARIMRSGRLLCEVGEDHPDGAAWRTWVPKRHVINEAIRRAEAPDLFGVDLDTLKRLLKDGEA